MTKSRVYTIFTAVVCVCLIASNIFETVIFDAGPLTLTGGFLIFPISYIINDCLSEVYGYKATRMVVFLAFGLNLAFVLLAQLVMLLPEAEMGAGYTPQQHFAAIFRADLRITAASMAAFVFGSLVNSKVMVAMRSRLADKTRGFGVRAVVSSLAGESIDSLIFFPIAFWGLGFKNILTLMVTQIILKTAYEVVLLPLTSRIVRRMRTLPE